MEHPASTPTGSSASPPPEEDKIRHFSAEAREAFHQFRATGDQHALDLVIFAILEDIIPRKHAQRLAGLPGSTQLIEDLHFDSLAITEVVFCAEDLFAISITNEEIIRVHTLDDLRGFVRTKVAVRAVP